MRWPGFAGGSYVSQSVIADCEQTVNFFVEEFETEGAKARKALYPTPGFTPFVGRTQGVLDVGGRAFCRAGSRVFMVIGGGFYELFEGQTLTRHGSVAQDAYPATISYNGVVGGQLFITSGGNGYCFVLATNTLTQVLTGDATMGAFCMGYFLAFGLTTGKTRLSNLNDGTVWDAATFFQRSRQADPYQCMFVDGNSLVWMIGIDSFEVRYNSGQGTQPFEPLSGLEGRYGIVAPFAWTLAGQSKLWLSRNADGPGPFVRTSGSTPQEISTYPISSALASYARSSTLDDAELMAYQDGGHTFGCLSFARANKTWCVDVDRGTWTERGYWNSATGGYDLWRPRVHGYAWGKHLVGDRTTGTIAWMDSTLQTELDGTYIRRLRRAPGLTNELKRVPIDRLTLLMDTGVGLESGQGSDPQVMLRFSADGGQTWGAERQSGFGKLGQYRRCPYWTRFGTPSQSVVEISVTDPVPTRLIDLFINNAEAA